ARRESRGRHDGLAGHAPVAPDGDGVGDLLGGLPARDLREEAEETADGAEREPADHAFVPESARNARRSLSGATSTSISSPRANSPTRIFSDSGSSTYFWMARFSGRAPKCSSYPRSTRKSVAAGVSRSVTSSPPHPSL